MQLIVTIKASSVREAAELIASVPSFAGGVELRADGIDDAVSDAELRELRGATPKPMIYTRRSTSGSARLTDFTEVHRALDAGFDLADVEFSLDGTTEVPEALRARVILSFHDFNGVPPLPPLLEAMQRTGCRRLKIAATPQRFADNHRLLDLLSNSSSDSLTVIGMGSLGLYSRILAPMFGSGMMFTGLDDSSAAAPGQLSAERVRSIFGDEDRVKRPVEKTFAVIGNPSRHSLSPVIHNERFRRESVPAAYSIIETEDFLDVANDLASGRSALTGLSITAPFKEEAFRFAVSNRAGISSDAVESEAVNTLVRNAEGKLLAENSDVDGMRELLRDAAPGISSPGVAILGAGATARSALVALKSSGARATIFNRTRTTAEAIARRFSASAGDPGDLDRGGFDVIINTLPSGASLELPEKLRRDASVIFDVSYSAGRRKQLEGERAVPIDGLMLLAAQARRQSELFLAAVVPQVGAGT